MYRIFLAVPLVLSLLACSGADKDDRVEGEPSSGADRTRVIFGPADLPIPNDTFFSRQTIPDGTMFVPGDSTNPVIAGIDALDGNSVIAPIDIEFTDSLDPDQILSVDNFVASGGAVGPNLVQNVFLLPLDYPSGDALVPASVNEVGVEIPTFSELVTFQTAIATEDVATLMALAVPKVRAEIISLDGKENNVLRIMPLKPLKPQTRYLVILTRIKDAEGQPVLPSFSYEFLTDPDSSFDTDDSRNFASAVGGWTQLAGGYFGFIQQVIDSQNLGVSAPILDDIIFTLTFTTGGTDSVLKSLAAPELFFEESTKSIAKKAAIEKVVSGVYALSGEVNGGLEAEVEKDAATAGTLAALLTQPAIGGVPNSLYNPSIAAAIASGADYGTILAGDASAGYLIQKAAAEAAAASADFAAIGQGAAAGVVAVLPRPVPRDSQFFRSVLLSDILPEGSPLPNAQVIEGEIALPNYQGIPSDPLDPNSEDTSGAIIKNGVWKADEVLGAQIGAPPSEQITYRYPFPAQQAVATIPVVVTAPLPVAVKPENGWPVVIFVHGIRGDRSHSIPIAAQLANACLNPAIPEAARPPCFATLAIDQVLHGVAPQQSPSLPQLTNFSAPDFDETFVANLPSEEAPAQVSANLSERHYNFTAAEDASPMPMDYDSGVGESGSLFIDLTNFSNGRDILRQMVMDLLNVNASLASMDIDGNPDNGPDFDISRVYVIGHSLGGITTIPFVAVNNSAAVQSSPLNQLPKIQAAAFLKTGGAVPRLLENSPSFAPTILGGLAVASDELTQGRSGLESYFNIYQGVLNSVDPLVFASMLSPEKSDTGILVTEYLGDFVIPNGADSALWGDVNGPLSMVVPETGVMINSLPAPFAGTEPLIAEFDATKSADVLVDTENPGPVVAVSRFVSGSHANPVAANDDGGDAEAGVAAFTELVSQIVTLFASNGTPPASLVTNPEVLEP